MKSLAAKFGNPQDSFKSIHIAGTNGKGSVAHKTAAALQAAGYKVGLFTSPHLESFCERIQVNNKMITEKQVVKIADPIFELVESKEVIPTFFEIITMIAFKFFKEQKVDYAVLECGLGGRFDSTNIVKRVSCTAVVSIGSDHQDVLGATLKEIAA